MRLECLALEIKNGSSSFCLVLNVTLAVYILDSTYSSKMFDSQNNMVIEYIGSIIRNEVANKRERIYESQVSRLLFSSYFSEVLLLISFLIVV